jgi:hypothetical protein
MSAVGYIALIGRVINPLRTAAGAYHASLGVAASAQPPQAGGGKNKTRKHYRKLFKNKRKKTKKYKKYKKSKKSKKSKKYKKSKKLRTKRRKK